MKTAVSIPERIFEAAERLARHLGVSRSELYATAIAEFLEDKRFQGVTERLNEVYAKALENPQTDPVLDSLQMRSLPLEDW